MASGKISEPVKVLKAMSKRVCSIRKAYTILHSKAWMTQKFAYTEYRLVQVKYFNTTAWSLPNTCCYVRDSFDHVASVNILSDTLRN